MSAFDTKPAVSLIIESVPLTHSGKGQAFFLPVADFPVTGPELELIKGLMRQVITEIRKSLNLRSELLIQLANLHLEDGASRLSSNAGKWRPEVGLGVWPDREPPTLYTVDEIRNLKENEKPRTLMHQVFRVTASQQDREAAQDTMLGLGTVLHLLIPDLWEEFRTRASECLLPPIKEESFRCFPFYVPLLERRSIVKAKADDLTAWLCGAPVYIRESAEDKGILMLFMEDPGPIFDRVGARPMDGQRNGWYFTN